MAEEKIQEKKRFSRLEVCLLLSLLVVGIMFLFVLNYSVDVQNKCSNICDVIITDFKDAHPLCFQDQKVGGSFDVSEYVNPYTKE